MRDRSSAATWIESIGASALLPGAVYRGVSGYPLWPALPGQITWLLFCFTAWRLPQLRQRRLASGCALLIQVWLFATRWQNLSLGHDYMGNYTILYADILLSTAALALLFFSPD